MRSRGLLVFSDPNVEYAEPIGIGHATEAQMILYTACGSILHQIYAPQAWEIHKGEAGTDEISYCGH